jgi:hypothetical protein
MKSRISHTEVLILVLVMNLLLKSVEPNGNATVNNLVFGCHRCCFNENDVYILAPGLKESCCWVG